VAIVGTGVIFGLAHGLVLALPILVGFGIGLAWLRSRSESVYPGMVLHGLFNAASLALGVFVIPENG
jgi:membrane protease YdiL (CAAX protease family)